MRLFFVIVSCAAVLSGQGGGGVQFRDLSPLSLNGKPAIACGDLRSLTTFDLSVISAIVIPASANAPQHCRVSLMVPPEINIEVNLPEAWNGRLYMDRKSTRLNSSHLGISYAVFCLKKKQA